MNALHLATLALATILVIAALGKLRQDDGTTREEWRELRVPEALNVSWLRRLHPYVELGVVALALLPGPFAALGAAGMLALTLGYAAAIIGAWRRPESVTCACFGSARRTEITGRTVVRNVLLVVLAVCAAIAALLSAGGPLGALTASAGEDVRIHGPLAAVMVLLVLAAGWFSAAPTGASAESAELAPGPQPEVSGVEDEMGDYLRTLTPRAPVVEADGTRTDLIALSRTGAQLLIFASTGCGGCRRVTEDLPSIRERLPQVQVRVVSAVAPDALETVSEDWRRGALFDEDGVAARMLQISGTPVAVLLGADGMLAGGPVGGADAIADLVEEMRAALAEVPAGGAEASAEPAAMPSSASGS